MAIGASAGGLEALEHFFKHMPSDAGMAFAVVQHLAPDHESALPQLLAKYTRMPVEQVRDNTKVAPDRVYIIPPNTTLTIKDGMLELAAPAEPRGQRTPIDSFFSSLAHDRGENAVCIMLSGTGTDGRARVRPLASRLNAITAPSSRCRFTFDRRTIGPVRNFPRGTTTRPPPAA